jgi:hypothetical protein
MADGRLPDLSAKIKILQGQQDLVFFLFTMSFLYVFFCKFFYAY